jgi:HPt (histidine-containing phosphotransfer) domain-containing protein
MDAGMDDYLTKPLSMVALTQTLERWLSVSGVADIASAGGTRSLPAPDVATALPVLMDFDRLAQFKEFDDDELTLTREVIGLFMADAAQRLDAIEQALRANDAQALSWACHALVGAAGNVGAVAMQAAANTLEIQAKTQWVPADALRDFRTLRDYWLKTRAVLDAWL